MYNMKTTGSFWGGKGRPQGVDRGRKGGGEEDQQKLI